MRLVIKRLGRVNAEIEGEKVVLYGPNGSGKSMIVRLVALALSKLGESPYRDVSLPKQILQEAEAVIRLGREELVVAGGHLVFRGTGASLSDSDEFFGVMEFVIWHIDEQKAVQLGQVERCGSVFEGYEVRFEEGFAVSCPWVARELGDVYYSHVYDPDLGWVPIADLSYGQRRRLAIEAALATGDYVFIENFEAGLHVDYLRELVEEVAESKAAVVVETHSGLVLKFAKQHGFSLYYVDMDGVKKIERLDDAELFKRELAAYQL
jgi:ABC-type cobalt transport system, ATPase component